MQWGTLISRISTGKGNEVLQLLCASVGLIGMVYGLQVLMVERTKVPVCSAELLMEEEKASFLEEQQLTVAVAGAVVEPGVWQLPIGARVAAAIEKAGGFSQRADRVFAVQQLNLAQLIKDGEKIYVPFAGENESSVVTTDDQKAIKQTGLISINAASEKELQTLTGIGEARAAQIVENRPYLALNELVSKEVISAAIFDDIVAAISL